MTDVVRPPRPARRPPPTAVVPIVDAGVAEVVDGVWHDADLDLDALGVTRLEIVRAEVQGVRISGDADIVIRDAHLDGCDLSGARVATLLRSTVSRSKLVGLRLVEASWADSVLDDVILRLADGRRASWSRLGVEDCDLSEMDLSRSTLADVSLTGCRLDRTRWTDVTAERVDLRGAAELALVGVTGLDGCVIDPSQLPAIAPSLAAALGLTIDET